MKKDKFITDFEDIPTPRQKMPHLSLEDRQLNFEEVELGFSEEIALKETSRCLSCRRCIGCGLCLAECDQQAIVYDQKSETTTLEVDSIVVASGTENFDARRKPELGYSHFPNVITSMEMERILSANGPYGGIIMRPSDGDVPQKIAFIQCVGSRDESLGQNYCSNICCVTALKQSLAAVERIEGLDVSIFYSDFRPFSNDGEHYFLKAKQEKEITFIQTKVDQVDQALKENNLVVKFVRNGSEETAEFDLVVLSTGIMPAAGIKRLSRQFGVRLNKYGFFPGEEQSPTPTSGEGVWFAGTMTHPTDIQTSLNQASAVAARVLQSLKQQDKLLEPVLGNSEKFAAREVGKRTGIFLCRYGLSAHFNIDMDDVIQSLKKNQKDYFVADFEYCCNSTGKKRIREAIENEKMGRVIIAPCFPETHGKFFQKLSMSAGIPAEKLLIFDADQKNGQLSTEDINTRILELAASNAENKVSASVPKILVKEVCVIGGSVEAVQSALEIADMGYKTHIVFSGENLLSDEESVYWHIDGMGEFLDQSKTRAANHPNIELYPQGTISDFAGEPGDLSISFKKSGEEKNLKTGIVIVAPGVKPHVPDKFLFKKKENVITQLQLLQKLAKETFEYKKIVMIQCIGSRDEKRSYCSQMCCEQAIQNALKIIEKQSDAEITILHRDIRVHDFEEDNYTEALENGVKFIRMDNYPEINSGNETIEIDVVNRISGQKVQLNADLLVLSAGVEPQPGIEDIASILNLPLNKDGLLHDDEAALPMIEMNQSGVFKLGLAVHLRRLRDVLTEATAIAGKVGLLFRNS